MSDYSCIRILSLCPVCVAALVPIFVRYIGDFFL